MDGACRSPCCRSRRWSLGSRSAARGSVTEPQPLQSYAAVAALLKSIDAVELQSNEGDEQLVTQWRARPRPLDLQGDEQIPLMFLWIGSLKASIQDSFFSLLLIS